MAKVYYITEAQYAHIVEKKKVEIDTIKAICEEIDKKKKTLTEAVALNEGILDTIKSYMKKGLLTAAVVGSLLASNRVNAQQLQQAGVPRATIEQGIEKAKHNPGEMSTKQIENQLIKIMNQNNLDGSLKTFMNLNPQQKEAVLQGIKSQIKSLDDVNSVSFGNWEKYQRNSPNAIQFDQKSEQKINVVTIDTVASVPVTNGFDFNNFELKNPAELKAQLTELLKGYTEVDSISIVASSSTLRNRGEAEQLTWKELSQKRADAISSLLVGTEVDLGGCGVNKAGTITPEMITINTDGSNGDGTSGPKSPYESNPEYVKSYQERGIDAKFWQSASKEDALPEENLSAYTQYQFVIVKIHGRVVETETEEVPSYKYVTLQVKKMGGKIESGKDKMRGEVASCPVMIKK